MSYFLCGKFIFGKILSSADLKAFAFKIVDESHDNGLSLQLGPCIVQPIVFEIVGEDISSGLENQMPFLITSSPISDVSDELIDFDDINAGINRLTKTLEQLQSFLVGLKGTEVVSGALIYFSEGYDEKYMKITSSLSSFIHDSSKIFATAGETVSLCVSVDLRY